LTPTVNALDAGIEVASSASLQVSVSVDPSTFAPDSAGATPSTALAVADTSPVTAPSPCSL